MCVTIYQKTRSYQSITVSCTGPEKPKISFSDAISEMYLSLFVPNIRGCNCSDQIVRENILHKLQFPGK